MFTQIDTKLWRGPRPDLADFTVRNELLRLGISTIINLEIGFFEWFHGEAKEEQKMCVTLDLSYAHVPLSDLSAPTPAQAAKVLSFIKNGTNSGGVLLHCLHGNDRTGWMSAGYRVKVQGWSVDKAIQEMIDMGFHRVPYEWLGWIRELREYLK